MIEYTAEYKIREGYITFRIPDGYQASVNNEGEKCSSGYMSVKFGKPQKPRTTGEKSQNSHAWGHCQQIAMATGMEIYEIEYMAKVRAIKRGYPITAKLGIPKSQKDINTEECAYLIEEYHAIAAENNILLKEE
jgi:hypothetical protein